MNTSEAIQILKSLLADFNKHTAVSVDLTNTEVKAIEFAIKELEDKISRTVKFR